MHQSYFIAYDELTLTTGMRCEILYLQFSNALMYVFSTPEFDSMI
jgi:hypothetical protein